MTNAPRARACLTTSFIGPASSPTRRAADLHQWSSHMSQMMKAVLRGSQFACLFETTKEFWPSPFTRERRFKVNGVSADSSRVENREAITSKAIQKARCMDGL